MDPTSSPHRRGTSLGELAESFVKLLESKQGDLLDIAEAEVVLGTTRRRLSDVISVLVGIGFAERVALGPRQCALRLVPREKESGQLLDAIQELRRETGELERTEEDLDRLIKQMKQSVKGAVEALPSEAAWPAYVTVADLKRIPKYHDKTLLAVNAPPGSTMHVVFPRPASGGELQLQQQQQQQQHGEPVTGARTANVANDVLSPASVNEHETDKDYTPMRTQALATMQLRNSKEPHDQGKKQGPLFPDEEAPTATTSPADSYPQPRAQEFSLSMASKQGPIEVMLVESLEMGSSGSPARKRARQAAVAVEGEQGNLVRLSRPPTAKDYVFALQDNEGVCDLFGM